MGVVGTAIQDLIQSLHYQQLFLVRQMQEPVLPNKLEDGGGVGDEGGVLGVFFKYEAQALLLLLRVGGGCVGSTGVVGAIRVLGGLLDLRLVEEHQVPYI